MSAIEQEAALRGASARRWTGVYAAIFVLTFFLFVSRPAPGILFLVMLGSIVFWVLCVIASVRALLHGRDYQHEEGRGAAFLGLFLTFGCIGLLVAYLVNPGTRR